MMKVMCAHNWGVPLEGWDGDKPISFRQCNWCKLFWFHGDRVPNVVIGVVVDEKRAPLTDASSGGKLVP